MSPRQLPPAPSSDTERAPFAGSLPSQGEALSDHGPVEPYLNDLSAHTPRQGTDRLRREDPLMYLLELGLLALLSACAGQADVPRDTDDPQAPSSGLESDATPTLAPDQQSAEAGPDDSYPQAPSGQVSTVLLEAFHRSGQTFITWPENGTVSGEKYKVYRSRQPITSSTLSSASLLATLSEGSGTYTNEVSSGSPYQTRYIITDLGPQLPAGVGLFVHTTAEPSQGSFYYAVSEVRSGVEQPLTSSQSLSAPVLEQKALPRPVAVYSNGVKTLYTHWMDYAQWNPCFEGYAYNFWVGMPKGGNASPLPLQMHLHAWGESWQRFWYSGDAYGAGSPYNLPTLWLEPDDHRNTWWYGFANNVCTGQSPTTSSVIVNYTEQRLIYLLEWIMGSSSPYLVDSNRVYLYGGSMGGTGALSFGLRHPEHFAGIYSLMGGTDMATSSWGRGGFDALWGPVAWNLPTNEGEGVWDRLDSVGYLADEAGESLPYVVSFHGRLDTTIEWGTQGKPWLQGRDLAQAGGPMMFADSDHGNSFDIYTKPVFANWIMTDYSLRQDESYLVASGGASDDSLEGAIPSCRGTAPYAYGFRGASLEWSSRGHPLPGMSLPVDSPSQYAVSLRLRSDVCGWPQQDSMTVTVARRQAFLPAPGAMVRWENRSLSGGLLQSGSVQVEANGQVSVPGVTVSQAGSVLSLTLGDTAPSPDQDGDGYSLSEGDCDDSQASVYPSAAERCDARDNDCDGQTDEGLTQVYYADADGDGVGSSSSPLTACTPPAGYVSQGGDCLDSQASVYPGAVELADGQDNDCDGQVDEGTASGQITLDWSTGIRDVHIRASNEGNYGKTDTLIVYNGGSPDYRALIYVDVSPVRLPNGTSLASAQLKLYATQASKVVTQLFRMTRGWVEGTGTWANTLNGATWKTYNGKNLWTAAGGDFDCSSDYGLGANGLVASQSAGVGVVSYDVTRLVQGWLTGEIPNYGVVVTLPSSTAYASVRFASRESSDPAKRPQLVLQYR